MVWIGNGSIHSTVVQHDFPRHARHRIDDERWFVDQSVNA